MECATKHDLQYVECVLHYIYRVFYNAPCQVTWVCRRYCLHRMCCEICSTLCKMRSAVDYDMGVPKAVPRMCYEICRKCSVKDYVMGVPKAVPRLCYELCPTIYRMCSVTDYVMGVPKAVP